MCFGLFTFKKPRITLSKMTDLASDQHHFILFIPRKCKMSHKPIPKIA